MADNTSDFDTKFQLLVEDLEKTLKIIYDRYVQYPTMGNWINSSNPSFSQAIESEAKQLSRTYGIQEDWVIAWVNQIVSVSLNADGTGRSGTYYEVITVVRAWKHYLPRG